MITQEDLKTIRERGYSDDEIWSKLAETNSDFSTVKERGYSLEEVASITSGKPMPEPEPVGTSIGDTLQTAAEELEAGVGRAGSAFAKSAVGSVKMFTDLFGANNKVSKEIAGVEDYIDQFTTAQAKQDKEEISRLFQEAEGKGLGNKVMAGLKAVAVSPETLGPEMAGYMLPSLAAGLLTGGASIPVQIGAQATIGAAQAAGSIKGDIYQSVRDYSREQGLDEVEADRAATEAQSYGGKNLDLILTNAGIGALAASTGAERIATRILTGRGKDVTKKTLGEFLKQGAAAGGVEALTEGTQEAAEQISQNIALQREGKDVPTFQNVPQVATMGAVAGGVIGGGLKGVEFLSAEEKAERDINRSADREARSLSATDSTTKKVINDLNQSENAIDSLRQELDTLEPTDPKAQQLRMRISEEQKKAAGLKQSLGEELSEPITTIEEQQAALAGEIAAPAEPTVKQSLTVQPTQAAPVVAPVEQVVTPPVEVAPLPVRTVEESIENKDTFEFEGMRGAVTLEDGTTVFRPFGTNDKYEVPINPNQAISEIEGIQWVRKGQTRQAPVEPTIPEVAAIVESQPQITEEEFNATEDDFQLPPSLIEIEKSPTLNAIADIFNTGESKIVQEGKRAKKVSATPEFYRQISPEQIDVANKQIDNALRIIDNLPVSEEQKQTLAEPYLLIDQDISTYENNPEYKQYKASIRREVRPADQAVTLPETAGKTKATTKKPKLGEKGGVLIPTKEDFIQAGQNIYEAGMEFGAWAKQMIQRFGDAVREFLGEVWQAVSGAPAKLNELMGYLPKKGEAGAVTVGGKAIKREQVMGAKVGPEKKTPEGIIAKTQELLRKQFDPSKVSDKNTTEAFRAIGKLTSKQGNAFAEELNDLGRVEGSEVSMGAALFVNDLFEYSIRLAAEGNKKMLGIMMSNINKLPTGAMGATGAGQTLRARLELAQRFLIMGQAEQDAYTNYVAEFIYGPNPTKEQIQSIKDAYAAVEKTPQVTEQELTDEIKAVGDRSGTDLVGKINEEFTKATEKKTQQRKTEEAELDEEYKKVQKQADAEIEKLAKIQSDTPSFDPATARQTANDVRAIVAADLKQRPDMGRKAPWKSMLVAKLQEAGVELAAAETLADIVWRQHEINNLSRELSSINKAIEKGPISEIVKAIKDTPLEDQQNPNWRYEVMRDYLRRAGLNVAQSERIAKLMDISLQKRFTMAQEQAFTDAISKSAPWKAGDTRSRRAFQKVLQALRAGALDPARNVLSDMAALNGWTGFTPDQYKTLLKNDAILSDPEAGELKKAEAYKAIQDVISKAKLPIRARDVIGQYYDAQALSGIPTLTVNAFSPIAFAMRNAIVEIGSGTLKGNPKAITNAATALVDSIKSWANTVAFSFKNNVTVYSNVDYIVNDDNLLRLYRKGVDQFTKSKNPKERADGIKNMMVGMMDYVRRMLNALDYGAIASLQNQNISKYSMAVMKRQGMSTKEGNEMFAVMMKAKNDFYLEQIAIGTDKNKASILADEFYISSWNNALTKAGVQKSDIKQAMDAAINDALSSVGRNRQSIDALKDESTKLKDAGVASMPALWLLESMASASNQTESQILKLFSRIIYGYAIVPARVIRETAWFSPYGFVRFGYDWLAKKMNKTSPYAQSLGTDVQYSQRLNEAIAGTVALIALASLRAGSTDEPEEDEFKIVFTGNGPKRSDDPQFYDSWYKAGNKPNTMSVYFGKSKFDLNMMRGFEAFTWPAMTLGALDDLEIRKKQKRDANTGTQLEDASIVAGFVFDAALRRGPYAFTTKSLFGTYGDIGVEGVAKGLTFPAKTLIPVLGTSLASNISNFINDPIDRRTLDGAVWSNIPFIGPAVAPKSLNAFGEPALSTDFASKMFKLGVPIVYDIPTDRESIMLHELVLSKGGGPSIPTRNQLAQRLDRDPTNKEYEMFVKEYGSLIAEDMKANYTDLFEASAEGYSKYVEKIGNVARDIAETRVREKFEKP
jgi:hypothetical protein